MRLAILPVVLAPLTIAGALFSLAAAAQTPVSNVLALAVDPHSPSTVYAATDIGVFQSKDAGDNWVLANDGLGSLSAEALAVDPNAPTDVYAATEKGVFVSRSGGLTWNATATPPLFFDALAIAPDSTAVYAGGHELFLSRDRGATWIQSAAGGGTVTSLAIDPFSPTSVWLGVYDEGLRHSTDGGGTFLDPQPDLVPQLLRPASIVFDSRASGTFYVAGPPHFGFSCLGVGGGLVKTTDGGADFRLTGPLGTENLFLDAIAVDPADSNVMYAGATTGGVCNSSTGGVHRSRDGGATWTAIPELQGVNVTAIAIAPTTPETNLVASYGSGIIRSADGGITWQRGPTAGPCVAAPDRLCLQGGRFQVQVSFHAAGAPGTTSRAVSLTSDAGYFWFFTPNNVELAVKLVDGRAFNGRFWFFVGSLSDVEYTVAVTDLTTGARKIYDNPSGRLVSIADTAAF